MAQALTASALRMISVRAALDAAPPSEGVSSQDVADKLGCSLRLAQHYLTILVANGEAVCRRRRYFPKDPA